MAETRESESAALSPGGERPRHWWMRPLARATGALYLGQLAPFVAGPLTECGHCVGNYLKFFPLIPGMILGQWMMHFLDRIIPGNQRLMMGPDWIRLLFGILVLAVMFYGITMITAKLRGKWHGAWLVALALASAANALIFSALLRA